MTMDQNRRVNGSGMNWLKHLGLLYAFLALGALAWAGGDPWKDKPYTQWDDKDIQHVMTSSPWMRSVSVVAAWQTAPDYDMPGDNPHPASQPSAPSGGGGGGMGAKPGAGPASSPSSGPSTPSGSSDSVPTIPQAEFSVFWMSSRTMRGAMGRREVLHAGKDAAVVDAYVNQPMDEYEIVVSGRDMNPFVNNDEKFFQAHSFLEIKKSKEKLAPSHVTFERGANGKTVTGAFFFFPKKSATGENEIAPDEKSVQFTVSLGKSTLKAEFDPRKMDDQKGPDL
jgi:hypothetical protein